MGSAFIVQMTQELQEVWDLYIAAPDERMKVKARRYVVLTLRKHYVRISNLERAGFVQEHQPYEDLLRDIATRLPTLTFEEIKQYYE